MPINRPGISVIILLSAVLAILFGAGISQGVSVDTGKKVLVVMSYDDSSDAELKIKEGIASVLTEAQIKYFFMDTKNSPQNGSDMAREAYKLYQEFHPDAVITADDNAQSFFVLPYLMGKVETPIVFCGVNDDAGKYGYPTGQITGVLEKKHYQEGISFAQLIVPEIQQIGVIYKENASNIANIAQINKEMSRYPVAIVDFKAVRTTQELNGAIAELEEKADALLVLNLAGITDENGASVNDNQGMELVAMRSRKPTIGSSKREIDSGLLCGVAKLNTEQGLLAATMVKEIFAGKAVADIPVAWNRNGQRVINVTTARKLNITLKPVALIGTDLVQ